MANITKAGVDELTGRYKKTYIDNPSIMLSGYRQENQTVSDYDGRQLLELMQNADDARSEVIYISLDRKKSLLSISNNGDRFSLDGIESLMYTGLSTKNKAEFIGNKGLGFRSILNWVNWVKIQAKEISIRFSKSYSEEFFDKEIAPEQLVQEKIEKDIAEKKLSVGEKPIAALAFPEILEEFNPGYTTTIVLEFKTSELTSIEKQLAGLSEEILLFLPNVKKLLVETDGLISQELNKSVDEANLIVINGEHWNRVRSAELHYEEKIKYKYSIAWKDDWDLNGYFYNYFPTDVPTDLPCIIHATFDLTNNRKEINGTAANKHILKEIVTALGDIAEQQLKKPVADWRAYQFLTRTSNSQRAVLDDFYQAVLVKRESLGLYPTVDNRYVKKEDAVYHGDVLSIWVEENGLGKYFPGLLKSNKFAEINLSKRYSAEELAVCIDGFNSMISMAQRVDLLGILALNVDGFFDNLHRADIQIPLILNSLEEIVPSNIRVFTKDTEDYDLQFPDFIDDIQFISANFYNLIRDRYKKEITANKLEKETGDARAVKRLFEPVVNIGLDDVTGIIQHIVSETNKILGKTDSKQSVISQMVNSLYSIFLSNPNRRGNLSTIERIPLFTRSGEIKYSTDLYFGKEYSRGVESENIFSGIRADDEYLAGKEIFKLEAEDEILGAFYKWLNVNELSKFETITKSVGRWETNGYSDFIIRLQKGQRTDVHKFYEVKAIRNIEETLADKAFSIEQLIAWIAKDERFLEQLRFSNSDIFFIEFNKERKEINQKPSYLLYLILSSGITRNVIASLDIDGLKLFRTVDSTSPFFKALNIPEYKIQEIIDLLHIKSSFNNLRPEQVYQLLKSEHTGVQGNSQSFYKIVNEYFRANEKTLLENYTPEFKEIEYHARRGGIGKDYSMQPVNNVYYSDNKLLPQKILNDYWFINLPKRSGESRISKFFGVKLIKDIIDEIHITVEDENEVNYTLNQYLDRLKPYWLSYRLQLLSKKSDKEEAARNLKALKIQVVNHAAYTLSSGQKHDFDEYEFIPKDNLVVVQCGLIDLNELRHKSEFCDLIAEIVCIVFKIAEQNLTYRRIFKDGVKESLHILRLNENEYLLEEAKKLLGISEEELKFWGKIYPRENLDVEKEGEFSNNLVGLLGERLPAYYNTVDFANLGTKTGVEFLEWLLTKINFNLADVISDTTLHSCHHNQISNLIKDYSNHFEKLLWLKADSSADVSTKKDFFNAVIDFTNASSLVADRYYKDYCFVLRPDFELLLLQWVNEKYHIDLKTSVGEDLVVATKYKHLLKSYAFGTNSTDDKESIIKKENPALYSLMYFDGFQAEVIKECEKQFKDFSAVSEEQEEEDYNLVISEGSISKSAAAANSRHSKPNGSSHHSKGDHKKALSGKKQEDKVRKSLKNQGYLVNDVSGKTDSKHYDLEYKKEGETEWRFLEIKKDSGGYFFLSKPEKDTAMSAHNAARYDLAIVGDNCIHIIKNPFLFEEESFEQNSRFSAVPTEYKVSFTIDEK